MHQHHIKVQTHFRGPMWEACGRPTPLQWHYWSWLDPLLCVLDCFCEKVFCRSNDSLSGLSLLFENTRIVYIYYNFFVNLVCLSRRICALAGRLSLFPVAMCTLLLCVLATTCDLSSLARLLPQKPSRPMLFDAEESDCLAGSRY